LDEEKRLELEHRFLDGELAVSQRVSPNAALLDFEHPRIEEARKPPVSGVAVELLVFAARVEPLEVLPVSPELAAPHPLCPP
jgi:hypothetical protein